MKINYKYLIHWKHCKDWFFALWEIHFTKSGYCIIVYQLFIIYFFSFLTLFFLFSFVLNIVSFPTITSLPFTLLFVLVSFHCFYFQLFLTLTLFPFHTLFRFSHFLSFTWFFNLPFRLPFFPSCLLTYCCFLLCIYILSLFYFLPCASPCKYIIFFFLFTIACSSTSFLFSITIHPILIHANSLRVYFHTFHFSLVSPRSDMADPCIILSSRLSSEYA